MAFSTLFPFTNLLFCAYMHVCILPSFLPIDKTFWFNCYLCSKNKAHVFSSFYFGPEKKKSNAKLHARCDSIRVLCVCVFSVVATSQLVDSNMLKAFLFFFILMLPYSSLKCWPNQCLHLWTFPVNGHRFLLNITHTNWHKICKIFGLFQQRARCKKIIISNKWSNWREKPITKKKTENETVKWFVLSVST